MVWRWYQKFRNSEVKSQICLGVKFEDWKFALLIKPGLTQELMLLNALARQTYNYMTDPHFSRSTARMSLSNAEQRVRKQQINDEPLG